MLTSIKKHFQIGGRTIKTGISVFLTALICQIFQFPVIFAVMTAIVTIEHTAADSIKKAMVRFPASAIGAFLSVSFYTAFGKSAATYALAAMLTIAICHKLKLDEGIVVATLTAIAMIPDFQGNSFESFLVRLATTSIGIIVSTGVNFFLLPPDYTDKIHNNMNRLFEKAARLNLTISEFVLDHKQNRKQRNRILYQQIIREINQTYRLIAFQREEWRYHRYSKEAFRQLHFCQKKLTYLQQMIDHVGNLQFVQLKKNAFNEEERKLLHKIFVSIADILRNPEHVISEAHYKRIETLDDEFWHWKEEHIKKAESAEHLPPQTIVLYELLFLHRILEELQRMTHNEHKIEEDK
ncbi:aromatic acid exporter family protein [Salinibacillus aidingensis]|uniref:Aromatic acid exporter family protein n=1 Tax=Salinibacillus aidingensis TaxID=237684 RepID=A0ABN1BCB3_9BACI